MKFITYMLVDEVNVTFDHVSFSSPISVCHASHDEARYLMSHAKNHDGIFEVTVRLGEGTHPVATVILQIPESLWDQASEALGMLQSVL